MLVFFVGRNNVYCDSSQVEKLMNSCNQSNAETGTYWLNRKLSKSYANTAEGIQLYAKLQSIIPLRGCE